MKVVIASDHAGFELKKEIISWLESKGFPTEDLGPFSTTSVHYPEYAQKLAHTFQEDTSNTTSGILICGSGMGMSIAANRHVGVRAALCREELSAKMARAHNNANVLVLGARFTGSQMVEAILDTWFHTDFEGGRHQDRVELIEKNL